MNKCIFGIQWKLMPCYVTNNMTIGRNKQYKSIWNPNSKLTQSSRCRVCILSNERIVNTTFHSVFFPPLDCCVLPKTINTTRLSTQQSNSTQILNQLCSSSKINLTLPMLNLHLLGEYSWHKSFLKFFHWINSLLLFIFFGPNWFGQF